MKLPEAKKTEITDVQVEYEKFFTVSLDMLLSLATTATSRK